jgi:hypothetical protein
VYKILGCSLSYWECPQLESQWGDRLLFYPSLQEHCQHNTQNNTPRHFSPTALTLTNIVLLIRPSLSAHDLASLNKTSE